MLFITITDCSDAQIIPLSKVLESTTELTAILISAVSCIIAGTFPGPTPIAGFPEEYAALTIPGPPVARTRFELLITALDNSKVGSSIQPIISFGAPACTAASKTILAAIIVDFLALGWGEKIIPFLVFKAIKALKIAVEVGLVVGTIAAITPIGSAIFVNPKASSFSITPQVFHLYICYKYIQMQNDFL